MRSRSALAGQIDDSLFQSLLSWDSASLWGIEIGAVELPFATTGRHFRLLEPRLLPIFDGGLAIGTLRVRHAGTEQMYVRFDAELKPISVAKLSRALGWPEFQGTLSGEIPDLQLSQGVVTLGGNIHAAVFGGNVVIRDVSLRDPLGKFPRLFASIDIDNLDLAQVTSTFSFGMITGRLSGQILGLETFNWMPESFDARFYTPADDRSKHRISQRAVRNLSSIGGGSGGGVAAALQGGFLKFFDDFGYERLGLSCRLARDVCTMSGVEPTNGGYYIVKGKGLPRINVIGGQKRVAWKRLVRQLGRDYGIRDRRRVTHRGALESVQEDVQPPAARMDRTIGVGSRRRNPHDSLDYRRHRHRLPDARGLRDDQRVLPGGRGREGGRPHHRGQVWGPEEGAKPEGNEQIVGHDAASRCDAGSCVAGIARLRHSRCPRAGRYSTSRARPSAR